jgi:hypothetical protein
MLNVVEQIEPNISEVTKKGNALLQLGEFPEEPSFREDMSNLPRSVSDTKRKLEEKQELLEAAIEKNKAFDDVAEQLENWVAATAVEPVFAETTKITNPVAVEKRLQQLEVILYTVVEMCISVIWIDSCLDTPVSSCNNTGTIWG